MRLLPHFLSLIALVNSYKFLVYSTQFAKSHVNFLARLSDTLVDAGHEVVRFLHSKGFEMLSVSGDPLTHHEYSVRGCDDQESEGY